MSRFLTTHSSICCCPIFCRKTQTARCPTANVKMTTATNRSVLCFWIFVPWIFSLPYFCAMRARTPQDGLAAGESSAGGELRCIAVLYSARPMHVSVQSLIWTGLAASVPLLLWMALALTCRKHPRLLPLIYPGLKVFSWITAIVMLGLGLLLLFDQSGLKRAYWLSLTFHLGIQAVRFWAWQRVVPHAAAIKSYEGWWPAKKDF
jgi:hypothetical protein